MVSRAIFAEMRAGRSSPNGGVYISMAHLGPARVAREFKGMVKRCHDCGFDLAGGLVEVVPTAHYLMGGVVCGADTATALPGLFVAGEDAGGVHGANRLGGNGVANSTVFGGIAGEVMAEFVAQQKAAGAPDETILTEEVERALHPFAQARGDLNELREALMDIDVGRYRRHPRNATGIDRALARLGEIERTLLGTGVPDRDRSFDLAWHDWLNLRSLIETSRGDCACGAMAGEFPRRALSRGFPAAWRSCRLALFAGVAAGWRTSSRERAGRLLPCTSRRNASQTSGCRMTSGPDGGSLRGI